jgi:hypothetical protein
LKAAHYKSKAKRFHSQILAFTKVRDQTWVNGFSWVFGSFKDFMLNPLTSSLNLEKLKYMDFMDVPDQAILELRGIGRELIPDVPKWAEEDAEPADQNASTQAADIEASAADRDSEEPNATKP